LYSELTLAVYAGSPLPDGFNSLLYFAALADSDRWWWVLWLGLVDSAPFEFADIECFVYAEVKRYIGNFKGIAVAALCAECIWADILLL
jgi:hypothetical protein